MQPAPSILKTAERGSLALLALAAALVWAVVWLGGEVIEGDTHAFDEMLLLALRVPTDLSQPIGPPVVQEAMRDLTALGGVVTLALLTLGTAVFLWLLGQRSAGIYLVAAIGSGVAVSQLAKSVIDRPRPDLVPHDSFVHTASFPSGHSMLSAIVYLTLAVMLARTLPNLRAKVFVILAAIGVSLLVGISRVYLGVHWPSDVLAGWAGGAAWALLCAALADWLARRGNIEPETPSAAAAPGDGPTGA